MSRRPPRSTRTDTLFPDTTPVRSVFNTASEILAPDWLRKLAINLAMPNVGLVGATASYESLNEFNSSFPAFPNVHIRSTAFMIDRKLFLNRSEEHTSELQSLMRISYDVFCLKKKITTIYINT